jgi:CelD/BcsL family acetyltransferase involved in cellulose biosynthesis
MQYIVTEESLADLGSYRAELKGNLKWAPLFVLPEWLRVWWQVFGSGHRLFIRAVRQENEIIGIAPLKIDGKTASFTGSADVCDYLDFIIAPGRELDFFKTLLDDLRDNDINLLDLHPVRPDASVLTQLVPLLRQLGHEVQITPEDVSLEMDLPSTFDEYLGKLDAKQRHEVRRKFRKLSEGGKVNYYFIEDGAALPGAMDNFLRLFTASRQDKATFMTGQMETYFRLLADTMAGAGLLKLGVLELDTLPVAMIMCFDYDDCRYLYNSGYDTRYDSLSVGLLSKALGIKDSIESGKKKFDFLKGAESYKYHLGGKEVPLYRCQVALK